MEFLTKLIVKVLLALIESLKPKAKEGAGPGKLEARLRNKIKKDGWT